MDQLSTYRFFAFWLSIAVLCLSFTVQAEIDKTYIFNVPKQQADSALRALGRQAGITILYRQNIVKAYETKAFAGRYSVTEAAKLMLENSSLQLVLSSSGHFLVRENKDQLRGSTMQYKPKKNILAAAIAFILAPMLSSAQQATPDAVAGDVMEEITVTGFRASLERSIERKRNAAVIGDFISAEDISDFADQDLGFALSRIPGVSRVIGDGSERNVQIRGLSQTKTLVNGRVLRGVNGGGRYIRQENISTEVLGGVAVYKTPSADMIEGGIGGTIDLKTYRPFDFSERKLNLLARGSRNDNAGETGHTLSGLYSDRWDIAAGEVGFLFSASQSEASGRTDNSLFVVHDELGGDYPGAPASGFLFPRVVFGETVQREPETLNITTSIQWAPNDNSEFYAELFYNDFEVADFRQGYGFILFDNGTANNDFSNNGSFSNVTTGVGGQVLTADVDGGFFEANAFSAPRFEEAFNFAVGGEVVADNVTYSGEVTYYSSEGGSDFYGPERYLSAPGVAVPFSIDVNNSKAPLVSTGFDATNVNNLVANNTTNSRTDVNSDEFSLRGDVAIDVDWGAVSQLQFGLRYNEFNRQNKTFKGSLSLAQRLPGSGPVAIDNPAAADLLSQISGTFNQYISARVSDYRSRSQINSGMAADGLVLIANRDNNDSDLTETTFAGYGQLQLDTEIAGIPVTGNIGARLVDTDRDVDAGLKSNGVITPVTFSGGSTELLPSLNLNFRVRDDFSVRFSAARTLSRQGFGSLTPRLSLDTVARTAKRGNPDLQDFESDQLELSFEWYFDDGSLINFSPFWREANPYNQTTIISETLDAGNGNGPEAYQTSIPTTGQRGDLFGYEMGFLHTWETEWGNPGLLANYTYTNDGIGATDGQGNRVTIPNLSEHQANTTIFYAIGDFEARLSYSFRSEYTRFTAAGSTNLAEVQNNVKQLDFAASYDVNDNISFTVDVSNLTDEVQDIFLDETRLRAPFRVFSEGRTFTAGVRYAFD